MREIDVTADGDQADAVVDVVFGIGLFRVPMTLVSDGDEWLIDGMGEVGAPPAPEGVDEVDVIALDYQYQFDAEALASGRFRLDFRNEGTQQHEISLFHVPAGVDAAVVVDALGDVDGGSFEGTPAGYEVVEHLTFAEPGGEQPFLLADSLDSGDYAFVCFIPEGGLDDETGEPVNPEGRPHVQLGMVGLFAVD